MTRYWLAGGAVLAVAALLALLWVYGLKDYASLAFLQESGDTLRRWIDTNPPFGQLAYFGLYVLTIVLCLPAAAIMTLAAGFLFGFGMGVFLVLSASTTGATLLFLLASTSFGNILLHRTESFYHKYAGPMRKDAVHYMLFMRLVPGVPSPVANILPALFHVPLRQFIMATVAGITPGTLILVYLGQALGEAKTMADLVTPPVLATLALLGLAAVSPIILRKIKGQGLPE